ncbi:DHHW family protein [[Clostridium] polysaccharolyticum]|uniref:DHHW protein n=1 Tax=[Clostridium] polysaccharolyticum TaxID=29364 RepID=A0A1I0BPP5_9FIRM|nr:DHHW family protein [[Clostridium] polysaccharolyticum]SET08249.1 DHHW protein [[Clostridium] polysaccharolyticum]
MKRLSKIYVLIVFGMLALGGCLWIGMPQKKFSQMENRYLTTWPSLNVKDIMQGNVQKQMANAANDQFVLRDVWMQSATQIQKGLGIKDLNGVYFGRDGAYYEKVLESEATWKRYKRNIGFVENFAKKTKSDVAVMLVPTAGTILKEELPDHAAFYDADKRYEEGGKRLKNASWIQIQERLNKKKVKEQVYFHTDHHWTTQGAYEGYCAYLGQVGKKAFPYEYFKPECVSETFYGTLYSKAPVNTEPDQLVVPVNIPACHVTWDGKQREGIYVKSKLKEKDQYGVYFGGNYGMVEIVNEENVENETLVIIKDSYANSLVPYLLPHYKKIVMLDLRYYNESVKSTVEQLEPEEILILYEMSRFSQDSNLVKLMR